MSSWLPERGASRRAFGAAASAYEAAAVLQQEVATRLDERLEVIKAAPSRVLDLGCGTGFSRELLKQRYPKASIVGLDQAIEMVRAAQSKNRRWRGRPYPGVVASAEKLPFKDHSFDLVVSSLMLQWCPDPEPVFREVRRVLSVDGLFLFSSLGPDTLTELRQAWRAVDEHPRVNVFLDMHDVGDTLMRARFADPVMEVEAITMTYPNTAALVRDLKSIGASNVLKGRPRGLTGKSKWQRFAAAYEAFRQHGVLPATYEVVYGHAWAPAQAPRPKYPQGDAVIPVSAIGGRQRGASAE